MTAIPTLLSSLQHGELAVAETILEKIQVDSLPEKTSHRLLIRCLEACQKSGDPRSASLVLSFWEDESVDDPRFTLPLTAKLFTLPELSDKVLKFCLPADATASPRTAREILAQDEIIQGVSHELRTFAMWKCRALVR